MTKLPFFSCMLFLLRLSIPFLESNISRYQRHVFFFSCCTKLFKLVHHACLLVIVLLVLRFPF